MSNNAFIYVPDCRDEKRIKIALLSEILMTSGPFRLEYRWAIRLYFKGVGEPICGFFIDEDEASAWLLKLHSKLRTALPDCTIEHL